MKTTEKPYRWKETWRDHAELDWLANMETCEEAIDSLNVHIENCDRIHDGPSIKEAEKLILDIKDEIEARKESPEWPTQDHIMKYCGKYMIPRKNIPNEKTSDELMKKWNSFLGDDLSRRDKLIVAALFENEQQEFMSRRQHRRIETWNLTPIILKTRWVSESDFLTWRLEKYGLWMTSKIEPIPEELIDEPFSVVTE